MKKQGSIEEIFEVANRRAAGWSETQKPVPWEPAASRRDFWRFAVALVVGVALVASLARYLVSVEAPNSQPVTPSVAAPMPESKGAVFESLAPPSEARHDSGGIRQVGGLFAIDLERAPVHEAIQMLAAASGFVVNGADSVRSQSVTVHWQGGDAAAAWQRLLGGLASFSIACPGGICQVWIKAPRSGESPLSGDEEPSAENLQPEAESQTK